MKQTAQKAIITAVSSITSAIEHEFLQERVAGGLVFTVNNYIDYLNSDKGISLAIVDFNKAVEEDPDSPKVERIGERIEMMQAQLREAQDLLKVVTKAYESATGKEYQQRKPASAGRNKELIKKYAQKTA